MNGELNGDLNDRRVRIGLSVVSILAVLTGAWMLWPTPRILIGVGLLLWSANLDQRLRAWRREQAGSVPPDFSRPVWRAVFASALRSSEDARTH